MGMKQQILDKIKRNLDILGIAATRNAESVSLDDNDRIISYVDSDLKKPMGGVDPSSSPYLGIGIANPGQLKLKGAAGENALADIFDDEVTLRAWAVMGNFANDKTVEAGDSSSELARIEGHEDLPGMGQ